MAPVRSADLERRGAGKDAAVVGGAFSCTSALGTLLRHALTGSSGYVVVYVGLFLTGAVLVVLGAVQWRTGRPLAFSRRLPYGPWRLLALCLAVVLVMGFWPWAVDRVWPR